MTSRFTFGASASFAVAVTDTKESSNGKATATPDIRRKVTALKG